MSIFKQWVQKRKLKEVLDINSDPASKFQFNRDSEDYAADYDSIRSELFKTVMTKYPQETMEFLNNIAQRGDEEISQMLHKLQRGKGPAMAKEPKHPSDKDTVMPSLADTGHNPAGDDN